MGKLHVTERCGDASAFQWTYTEKSVCPVLDYENGLAVKFQEAILSLPEKQRIVFNLRYYDELEYEEIARILDSKVDTLKVNYHYAKDKIKEYILNR